MKEEDFMNNPLPLIIFGATGDLYADKLGKALYLLFLEKKLPEDFKIIAFARRDFSSGDFRALTKKNILKKGGIDASKIDEFLNHLEYFQGDFLSKEDFGRLQVFLSAEKDRSIIFHLATSATLYKNIFENIKDAGLNKINEDAKILIEKPFGNNESDAKILFALVSEIFAEKNIFQVDHYLAKETVRKIMDFRKEDGAIEKIKINFHESNGVGSRGPSYDKMGAFLDVGQNHMLEILALLIMEKPEERSVEAIRRSRGRAIENLHLDQSKKIIKGQYEGYLGEPGVVAGSKTETFFRIFLRSKDEKFANASFELESGRALIDLYSPITMTTVSAVVYFLGGQVKEFKIQPVPGTVYDSYTKVYTDAMAGDQTLFVSMEEIIAEWRLADELASLCKNIPLTIYKIGSDPKDIN